MIVVACVRYLVRLSNGGSWNSVLWLKRKLVENRSMNRCFDLAIWCDGTGTDGIGLYISIIQLSSWCWWWCSIKSPSSKSNNRKISIRVSRVGHLFNPFRIFQTNKHSCTTATTTTTTAIIVTRTVHVALHICCAYVRSIDWTQMIF